MSSPQATPVHCPPALLTNVFIAEHQTGSVLGQLLAYVRALDCAIAEVTAELATLRAPTIEVFTQRDFLAELHQLSEFPAYTSARVDRNDEPLFGRRLWRGDVVTFQGHRHVVRKSVKRPSCGDSFVTLEGSDGVSSSLLTLVAKSLPSKVLWSAGRIRGVQSEEQFTFPDASPTKMDKVGYVGCGHDHSGPACLRRKPEPRFHQVTPEDVASGQWKHVAGIRESDSAITREFTEPLIDWCPNCKEYVAGNHDAKGIACKKYQEKIAAMAAETLEQTCAKWKAKWQRQRKTNAPRPCTWLLVKKAAKTLAQFCGDAFDRDILASRGSVMDEAVRQFDKDFSRKGNKYRVR